VTIATSLPPTHRTQPAPGLLDHALKLGVVVPLVVVLVAFPLVAGVLGGDFYVSVASRILIFALAATSLNLILGFGGMISFGHAAFIGLGAYTVVVLADAHVTSAWIAWPLAALIAAAAAAVIGVISLRTRGVYFIMITLAFAQMLYFLAVSIKKYGGEDGFQLSGRSKLGFGVNLTNDTTFYFTVLVITATAFALVWRLLNSRFGHVLQAIRENEVRMTAIGFPVMRFKLIAFVLAGGLGGLAGALLANQSTFVSPAMMQWSQSGLLMVMVILGGVGQLWGGVLGALVFLLLEEILSHFTIHWQLFLGGILLVVVLAAPSGLISVLRRGGRS
jgi:branched-chain amino acid transport system permease protein